MTNTFSDALPSLVRHRAVVLMKEAAERGLLISVAESCTGGLLAALLTDVEGYSHAFDRGFVSYSDRAKRRLLGVSAEILENDGAVSKAAAASMARGALENSAADIALSITGFAGKGAPDEEPGLVFLGLARRGRPVRVIERHYGDIGRKAVRLESLACALALLHQGLG